MKAPGLFIMTPLLAAPVKNIPSVVGRMCKTRKQLWEEWKKF